MTNVFEQLLEHKAVRYLKQFRELAVLLAFYVPYIISVASGSPVRIEYRTDSFISPISTSKIVGSERSGLSKLNQSQIQKFISSPSVIRIRIRNESGVRVADFGLAVTGVGAVTDVGIQTTSSLLIRDLDKISKYHLTPDGVVSFPELTSLPPGSSITLSIWGEFGPEFWKPTVVATASQWKPEISRVDEVSGLPLFLVEQTGTLTGLGIAILLLVGVRRATRGQNL